MYPSDYWTSVKAAMDGTVPREADFIECARLRCARVIGCGGIHHAFGTARPGFAAPVFARASFSGASEHNAQLTARHRDRIRHF